jgi:hypothetical protein
MPDVMQALSGGMTPEEAQMFALGSVPMLLAPEARLARPFAGALEGAEELFSQGGATIHKLQKPGRWPSYVATHPTGGAYQFRSEDEAMKWLNPQMPVMKPEPPASPMEIPPWEEGIKAYHGSPHDFPAFDISKVGTGQGAQSYGHGLYFAEEEKVAEDYRRSLTNPNFSMGVGHSKYDVGGERIPTNISGHMAIDTWSDMDRLAAMLKYKAESGYEDTGVMKVIQDKLQQRIAKFREEDKVGWHPGSAGEDMRALADFYESKLKNAKPEDITEARPGRLYEVNIKANPEHFLDWDKALNKQSKHVQEVLGPRVREFVEDQRRAREGVVFAKTDKSRWKPLPEPGDISGPDLYHRYTVKPMHYQSSSDVAPAAAQSLKKAGIPGIKYLDQGSREYERKTADYDVVIKQEEEILERMLKAHPGYAKRVGAEQANLEIDRQKATIARFKSEAASIPKPTYNYVVFDDKLIDIVKKYGIAGLVAGGASNWSPDKAEAGEVIKLTGKNPYGIPGMTGRNVEEMAEQNKKNKTRATLMRSLGGGADVLPITPNE